MSTPRLIADRYSLVEPLPGSATGVGWRARDLWSDQAVMITRVPVSHLAGHELWRARREIAGEVQALAGLRHDRLARPMDVVLDAGDLWVASERLPGVPMADELARRGAVEPVEVARWGRDVANGLAAVHAAGVAHRNLHAGTVGITEDGRAVIGGLATTVVTQGGIRAGTPVQVSPEVAQGATPSPAADVFALGALLYLAVEGHGPFPETADRDQLLAAVTAGAVAPPRRAGRLGDPLLRMLHPDPTQRPSAEAVANQLGQLAAEPGNSDWSKPVSPPAAADPTAARRDRMWWLTGAALVAVLALAGGLLVAFRPPWTPSLLRLPAAVPGLPATPIGDPRTADPCSLLNVAAVQRFGPATMFGDFGYPQTCEIRIETGGQGIVRLWTTFDVARDEPPAGIAERFGQWTIYRTTASDGECDRTVLLGDQFRVYVQAMADGGATTDLCAVADTGLQSTLGALSSGSLPRRDVTGPPNALTKLDTCTLLDQAALAQVPGLDATRRDPGFAGWLCIWGNNPAFLDEPTATVAVDRTGQLSGQPIQIGDRSAQTFPGSPGSCEVDLVQRTYQGSSGYSRVETLEFTVYLGSQQSTDAACRSATALAAAAAPKLPAPA